MINYHYSNIIYFVLPKGKMMHIKSFHNNSTPCQFLDSYLSQNSQHFYSGIPVDINSKLTKVSPDLVWVIKKPNTFYGNELLRLS